MPATSSQKTILVTFEQCERLREAARVGEILLIRYHGGNRPGTEREVAPIRVNDYGLMALDIESDNNKQYSLNKIEIMNTVPGRSRFHPPPPFDSRGWTELALTGGGTFNTPLVDTHNSQTATARLHRSAGVNPRVRLACAKDAQFVAAMPIQLDEVLGFIDTDAAPRYHQSLKSLAERRTFATCDAKFSGEDDGEFGLRLSIDLPKPTKLAADLGIKYQRVTYN